MHKLLHSITFIKTVHTVIFILMSALVLLFLYEVAVDRISYFSWTAVLVLLAEGVVLMANGWTCPLTTYAEKIGATHGQVTDIFLPKWFAGRIFPVCGTLFAVALLALVLRIVW